MVCRGRRKRPPVRSTSATSSLRVGERAAAMHSMVATTKLNGVDPRAWFADRIGCIANHPIKRPYELTPWNWCERRTEAAAVA